MLLGLRNSGKVSEGGRKLSRWLFFCLVVSSLAGCSSGELLKLKFVLFKKANLAPKFSENEIGKIKRIHCPADLYAILPPPTLQRSFDDMFLSDTKAIGVREVEIHHVSRTEIGPPPYDPASTTCFEVVGTLVDAIEDLSRSDSPTSTSRRP